MALSVPWLAAGSLLAGVASIGFIRFLWPYRDRPGARFFIATICAEALWCLGYGGALFVYDPWLRFLFEIPIWTGINFIGVFFLAFALEYTGRGELVRSKWMGALVALQLLHTLIVATNPIHGIAWSEYAISPVYGVATVTYTHGPWLFVNVVGVITMIAAGSFLLLDTFFSYGRLYRTQAAAVALSPVLPGIAFLVWLLQVGETWHANLTPLTFPIHLAFDFYAFFSRDLFELTPAARRVGQRAAIDDLGTGVVIVDEDDRIIDVNDEARTVLGISDGGLGRPLGDYAPDIEPAGGDQTIALGEGASARTYAVSPSPIEDASGRRVGLTIVLQDITRERRREQRLSVLNRVLRHNLRNDLNVVEGNVSIARDTVSDPEIRQLLDTATKKTAEVIDLGEKARDIERAVSAETDRVGEVVLRDLVRSIEADLAERFPAARITIEIPSSVSIEGDQLLLDRVFRNLMENGLEHATVDGPELSVVWIGIEDGMGTIEIRDTGPGLPDHEQAVLETGDETPLQHGSGLGLWLVKWGVDALGGEVRFEVDSNGTTAVLELPDMEDDDHSSSDAPSEQSGHSRR